MTTERARNLAMVLMSELNRYRRAVKHHFRLRAMPKHRAAARHWIVACREFMAGCGWREIERVLKGGAA